eukprot:260281_1
MHYFPNDKDHAYRNTECFVLQYRFCKTACISHLMNLASEYKIYVICLEIATIPIGIGYLFYEWLYNEILDDSSMEMLLKPGVISLNEACDKLLNGYACKYRFLRGLA